jgi:deoxyadenosine/deoxycytidine kinase
MPPRKYIAVAGNMGVGKSSLVAFLCDQFRLEPFYEPNDENPYLEDFYRDMPRWAFHSQMYFLAKKLRIHQKLEQTSDRTTVIQDRSIYEDAEIFAENLYRSRKMRKRDYQTYRALYESIVRSLRPPDLMIYLRGSLRSIKQRIKARSRPEEQNIPDRYLRRLNGLYEAWYERYELSEKLVLETDNMDYATDLLDRIDLLERIKRRLS